MRIWTLGRKNCRREGIQKARTPPLIPVGAGLPAMAVGQFASMPHVRNISLASQFPKGSAVLKHFQSMQIPLKECRQIVARSVLAHQSVQHTQAQSWFRWHHL